MYRGTACSAAEVGRHTKPKHIRETRHLQVMEDIRQQDRRLLEEDVLRQKESDAARCIQGAWKGWKLRIRLSQLKVEPSLG